MEDSIISEVFIYNFISYAYPLSIMPDLHLLAALFYPNESPDTNKIGSWK